MAHSRHDLTHLRIEYKQAELDERDVDRDPLRQFAHWFDAAVAAKVPEPNAMTLATVDAEGRPSARIVLLKEVDGRGLTFYTNYNSRKGRELAARPWAALLFFWPELERQIRIEGAIEKVDIATADAYFRVRPRLSRLGAWASPQSEPLAGRAALEARFADAEHRFPGEDVERPPHWGGYRLVPERFEFWQGRPSRLHDRVVYRLEQREWHIGRIAP
ncbi:MAG: pyridoxamine 5'-phosphate oxidase [Betaproteobacteria bacterium]